MADDGHLLALTTDITTSFVANNNVGASEVAGVIQIIHAALSGLTKQVAQSVPQRPAPAVSIRSSVQPDYIVDLFTGRKFKTLKRTLALEHGMTPEAYRAYWDLPSAYPMVAPNYAAARSAIARDLQGRKNRDGSGKLPSRNPTPNEAGPKRMKPSSTTPAKSSKRTRATAVVSSDAETPMSSAAVPAPVTLAAPATAPKRRFWQRAPKA